MISITIEGKETIFVSLDSVKYWASRDLEEVENNYFYDLIFAARVLLECLKPSCVKQ